MPLTHQHPPGVFDPGHCRNCAHQAGLLGHYHQVQRQEDTLRQAQHWARQAHRRATFALWAASGGILLAAVARLAG
jgi:hypothetical protein